MTRYLSSICLAALCASPAWAQPAAAPQDDGGIADIVVTAQRREEALQDVPIAITALGREQLGAAQVRDTLDLKSVTPGLTFNTAAAGLGQPRIRGVGTAAVGPGIENPVAVYIDGVYFASSNATLFSLNDVDQIAVLKGPQGTLFGRNATGGLIQVTTRQPSETTAMEARVTYGNLEQAAADVYLTGGLAPGLAASIAGYYDYQGEGFGKNLATGKDVQTHRNYAGRAKLYWDLDATRITLSADYSRLSSAAPGFRNLGINRNGLPTPGGPRDISVDVDPRSFIRAYGSSLTVRHGFGDLELTSITAYRDTDFSAFFDLDYTPAFGSRFNLNIRDKQFSQEVQLQSKGSGPFEWTVGGIYFWTKAGYDPSITTTPAFQIFVDSTQRMNSLAAFAQGTYALSEATNLTLGLRYSTDKREIDGTRTATSPFVPASKPQDDSKRFSKVTWRASLDHRFSPEFLGYVSYNRGFKSGAFVGTSFVPAASPLPSAVVLRPEVLDAFEAGFKSDLFDRHLRLNVAGFYYDYKNIQAVQIASGFVVPYNGKGAHTYGIDADAIIRVTRDLTVNLGGSWLHARYTSFPGAIGSQPLPGGGNLITPGSVDASGNRLQNTPDWTFNASATYTIPTSFGDLALTGSYYRNDGYFTEPENRVRQPAYELVDASITWTHPDEAFDVKLWGKNLTDEVYSNQLSATDSGEGRLAAPGRTYGVTAGFKF